MTPLPKRKHSRARQGKRRQTIRLKNITLLACPQCGSQKRPHIVCPNCGQYKGRVIVIKKEKKAEKKK